MPIDRKHLIGHADVPDGRRWPRRLVASHRPRPALELGSVPPPRPQLRRRRAPERQAAPARRPAARHRLVAREGVDRTSAGSSSSSTAASSWSTGAARSRTRLEHGEAREPRLQAAGARDRRPRPLRRRGASTIVVDNKTFALTSAGARPWMPAPSRIRLRVRPWGQKAAKMVFRVDGKRRAVDRRPPFLFSWSAKRAKPGKHVLAGGRDLDRRPRRHTADPARRAGAAEAEPHGRSRSPCRSPSPT